MGKETRISWTSTVHPDGTVTPGATWNPWMGCTKVTTECLNCYAERDMMRYGKDPHKVVRAKDATFYAPLNWKESKRVFVCSWSDFFHEDVDPRWRQDAWNTMLGNPRHTFIILTKRPQNIARMLPRANMGWPECYRHVWFLVSAGTNESLERFWPILRDIPELAVRGISMEPLLEDVVPSLPTWNNIHLGYTSTIWPSWVIVAGESGPNRRPMNPDWAGKVCRWCGHNLVRFFFKGHIGNVHTPENEMLDGKVYHEFPRVVQR